MISRRSMIVISLLLAALAAGAFFFRDRGIVLPAMKQGPLEDIVIGYNAPLTVNAVADFGIASKMGFETAIDEINARGGILGRRVRGIVLDDQGDKDLSRKNMEQLILQDEVLAVVGPGNSGNALHWLDLPQDNETVLIVPIATATEITQRYADRPRNYIFRTSVLDIDQARMLIAWAFSKAGEGKVAILHDNTGYGRQGVKDVIDVLERWGKAPVLVQEFDKATATVDTLEAHVRSAQAAGADILYTYSLADSNADAMKALGRVSGYEPIVLAPAANAVRPFWDRAGELAERGHFASPLYADRNDATRALLAKFIARYGTPPPTFGTAAYGYDAVMLLEAAIIKAGSVDHIKVRDALEATQGFQGVSTSGSPFSKNDHEASSPAQVFMARWEDGEVVYDGDALEGIEIR
jgi:branched-chain amino acid transport system substrate-binding protein